MQRTQRLKWPALLISAVLTLIPVSSASMASQTTITDNGTTITFPRNIAFSAHISTATGTIEKVILEYGVEKRTCGTISAEAFPSFSPASSVNVTWTWEMLKSGSEPPGTKIWYDWQVTDDSGNVTTSSKHEVMWLDSGHSWTGLKRDMIVLHWYDEPFDFANTLLDSTTNSLKQLSTTTGVAAQFPIDVYIYKSADDLLHATLYQPSWIGGIAFPTYNIVLIAIGPNDMAWGKSAATHEITHILVGHLTFGCLVSIPTWLNEGIAVYAQGGPDPDSAALFKFALNANRLLSIRSLSGSFSEEAGKADLSYSESYSIVNFLVATYGKDKLLKLFKDLRDGDTIDKALQDTYGFSLDTLDAQWRASIGAPLQATPQETATPQPSPTFVPTFEPVGFTPIAPENSSSPTPGAN